MLVGKSCNECLFLSIGYEFKVEHTEDTVWANLMDDKLIELKDGEHVMIPSFPHIYIKTEGISDGDMNFMKNWVSACAKAYGVQTITVPIVDLGKPVAVDPHIKIFNLVALQYIMKKYNNLGYEKVPTKLWTKDYFEMVREVYTIEYYIIEGIKKVIIMDYNCFGIPKLVRVGNFGSGNFSCSNIAFELTTSVSILNINQSKKIFDLVAAIDTSSR